MKLNKLEDDRKGQSHKFNYEQSTLCFIKTYMYSIQLFH